MNNDQFRTFLLNNIPNSKSAAGGREVVTDCPFCGKKLHLYIGMPTTDKPAMYNCFVCGESGKVTDKFLRMYFDIDDTEDINEFLNTMSKAYDSSLGYNKVSKTLYLTNPVPNLTSINMYKLKYINNRLGLALTLEEIAKNKICLNLLDLLMYNNIPRLTRDKRIVQALNDYFIGFISMDNGYVNLRKITDKELPETINKRYTNYTIGGSPDNHRRYYVPPVTINVLETIKVHIAEGPFDILSIKYNLRTDNENNLFIAACGKSYLSVIKLLLQDFGFINMEFHIYMDNDNTIDTIYNIMNYLKPFHYRYYIHSNSYPGEKDFGVPKYRIDEYIERIYC